MISRNTRLVSILLVVFMMVSMLASLSILPVLADEEKTGDGEIVTVLENEEGEGEGTGEGEGDDTPAPQPEKPITMTLEESIQQYLTTEYQSSEEKLANMSLRLTRGDLELYVAEATGEVAVKNIKTGQILLSNPYDVYKVSSDDVKAQLLSQVVVHYKMITQNGQTGRPMNSYADSAQRGQIKIRNVKNGMRVEYVLGKQSVKKLMPYWMEAQRFEKLILAKAYEGLTKSEYLRLLSHYTLKDPNDPTNVEEIVNQMKIDYKCTGDASKSYKTSESYEIIGKMYTPETRTYEAGTNMAIYVIANDSASSERTTNLIEGYIKQCCPDYNYEELDYDIDLTGYVGEDTVSALFTIAIEYYLDNDGFYYSVPNNSITYDADLYMLDYFEVNPFFGCTNIARSGYGFFPDGSGTLFVNEDVGKEDANYTRSAEIYGPDFAYHTLFYTGKHEVISMPVFGVIDGTEYTRTGELIAENALLYKPKLDKFGDIIRNPDGTVEYEIDEETGKKIPLYETVKADEVKEVEKGEDGQPISDPNINGSTGYYLIKDPKTAVVVETDETTKVSTYYPVDKDGNKIQQRGDIYQEFVDVVPQGYFAVIESGESLARITYVYGGTSHKYCTIYPELRPVQTDSYNLNEAMSVGADTTWNVTSERKFTGKFKVKYYMVSDFEGSKYPGNYVGMAAAYRDYLEGNGIISLLSDTKTDIPLYIESFGMIRTKDTFMTIPVWVDTAVTSFEDVETMYGRLAEKNITNINFRLNGFNDGGLDREQYATKIKYEKVLGGNKGYNALIDAAKSKGFGVFPNFDFANVTRTSNFDGFKFSKWTIKSIDDRYGSKRTYDATFQSFDYIGSTVVSPAYFSTIFEKFEKAFEKLGHDGISVGTLGSDLNSDFDRKEPYNREDDKDFTAEMLSSIKEAYGDNIMVDVGNAYTWKYVKHIMNISLDSSRYLRSTAAVPFMGMTLHGYRYLAGSPTNMQGNINYEILKIIENGANPYFTLSYENTQYLKELYPEYYSVDFDIWFDDLVETYNKLNDALKDVQTSRIKDHKFIAANRVLSDAEKVIVEAADAEGRELYQAAYDKALLKYNNAMAIAERRAKEAGKTFDKEAYVKENGEFEFMTFEEYYQSPIDTVIDDYTVVYEEYENGVAFVLNYNGFAIEYEGTVIESMSFIKLPAKG